MRHIFVGRECFVFCICGDAHVARTEIALRFLKRFTQADILVIISRSQASLSHDQVLRVNVPDQLSDAQATVYLKTALPRLVGAGRICCYLDSDQIATSTDVDRIFTLYEPPVTFARDHSSIDQFSRYAVNCPCQKGCCGHLRAAIQTRFNITVPDGGWRHWNGGLYLFDQRSYEFATTWHNNSLLAFDDPYWRVRDQGTLVATVWQQGLQDHTTLPPTVTRIVDRYLHYTEQRRASLTASEYYVDRSYQLGGSRRTSFLHFINGGAGSIGWPNWDEVAELIQSG